MILEEKNAQSQEPWLVMLIVICHDDNTDVDTFLPSHPICGAKKKIVTIDGKDHKFFYTS